MGTGAFLSHEQDSGIRWEPRIAAAIVTFVGWLRESLALRDDLVHKFLGPPHQLFEIAPEIG